MREQVWVEYSGVESLFQTQGCCNARHRQESAHCKSTLRGSRSWSRRHTTTCVTMMSHSQRFKTVVKKSKVVQSSHIILIWHGLQALIFWNQISRLPQWQCRWRWWWGAPCLREYVVKKGAGSHLAGIEIVLYRVTKLWGRTLVHLKHTVKNLGK